MIKYIKRIGLKKSFNCVLLFICICGAISLCLPKDSIAMELLWALAAFGLLLLGVIGIIFNEFPSFLFPIKGVFAILNGILDIFLGLSLFIIIINVILQDTIK